MGRVVGRSPLAATVSGPRDPLDNPVWHALGGAHATLAEVSGRARRYLPDVSIFAGLPDEPTPDDWAALALLVGAGGTATLFRDAVREPLGWERIRTIPVRQMVAVRVVPSLDADAVEMGGADLEEVLDLVAATRPGPFGARTMELGGYVGLRDGAGRLVAVAGHRMRLPGQVEISAVCTAPEVRGQGLGTRLVRHVVARAEEAGDGVFLHASADNVGAIRLYEALGFAHRRAVEAVALRVPGRDRSDAAAAGDEVAIDACSADG
ncbi:GNAT family N-acetyltransferase [Actinomarinicola tropica]|uniref:GNAT family N-acetyltransferase n=1 Tax=Actinomarinicola tropica TaxID=2789776 RepID=A0A5Q2RRH3_9ACTN|nr:GNAT family N-acetyltransferase [Actinomarinicola tropica]